MQTLAKWSIDEYHAMIAAGILHDRHVELLAGDIIEMSPETPLHYTTAKRGARYLETLLAGKADVRFNGPITLLDSEPEPDIAVVRLPESAYSTRHPRPEEIYWVIEVANTSVKKDLETKAAICASAGIQEYWVLDLTTQQLNVFRNPQQDRYSIQHTEAKLVEPLAFPQIQVVIQSLLI
jgi:Uma2 family endonuclease